MKNISNRRIEALSSQRRRNVKARIERLNESGPIFRLLKGSEYNFTDYDKGILRYRSLSYIRLSNILWNIKELTHTDNMRVMYYLDQEGNMCFEKSYLDEGKVNYIYFHNADLKPVIEYTMGIAFSDTPTLLSKVDRQSFDSRITNMPQDESKSPRTSHISYYRNENRIIIYTEELDVFLAGVAHIRYLLEGNPESAWLRESTDLEEGALYKYLSIPDDDENEVELFIASYEYEDYVHKGSISLEYGGALAEKVNSMLSKKPGADNEQLLELLDRLNRGKRVAQVLDEI